MGARQIWLGNTTYAQWVPAPAIGFTRHRERYAVELAYENGGGDVVASNVWRTTYEAGFPVSDARDYEGISAFGRFVSGEYGSGHIRFADPVLGEVNAFSARYAAPGLIEQGWPNWGASTPTYSNTTANVHRKPIRKATWTITTAANAVSGTPFTFLVPPGYYLHLGASGSATGTAQLTYLPAGGAASSITLTGDTVAPAFSATTAGGSTGASVTVYQSRTSTAASTLTLTSLWAAITPSSSPPLLNGHQPGEGHEGLRFAGNDPIPVEYVYGPRKLMSMGGVRLVETQPWE